MKGYLLLLVFIILPFVLSILLIRLQLNDYINKKNKQYEINYFMRTHICIS